MALQKPFALFSIMSFLFSFLPVMKIIAAHKRLLASREGNKTPLVEREPSARYQPGKGLLDLRKTKFNE